MSKCPHCGKARHTKFDEPFDRAFLATAVCWVTCMIVLTIAACAGAPMHPEAGRIMMFAMLIVAVVSGVYATDHQEKEDAS